MFKALCLRLMVRAVVPLVACGNESDNGNQTTPASGPLLGTVQCDASSDSCVDTHTKRFAISHAFVDPTNTVYYRVAVPAWHAGTDWGNGTNGFFHRATVAGGSTKSSPYVPFNGVNIGAGDRPMLPQFTFIVAADVSQGEANTKLTISACASDGMAPPGPRARKRVPLDRPR
jgi:hypothetical protein